jgi:hypothetical protein
MARVSKKSVFSYWFQKCKFDLIKKCTHKKFQGLTFLGALFAKIKSTFLKSVEKTDFWEPIRPIQRKKFSSHRRTKKSEMDATTQYMYFENGFYIQVVLDFHRLSKILCRTSGRQNHWPLLPVYSTCSIFSCALSPVSSFETSEKRAQNANFLELTWWGVLRIQATRRIRIIYLDPHTHQIKIRIRIENFKLDPEPDPQQFVDVKQKCLEYEPILELLKGFELFFWS